MNMENAVRKEEEESSNVFEPQFDFKTRRQSYNDKFVDHLSEQIGFIAGVLDMLFIVGDTKRWDDTSQELNWVILEARTRADELIKVLKEKAK